ncbi:MAG: hypothetical protein IPI46_00720 [Bacteroidetes bacterium]|nr:hypothetical protein [Bacteroidota bacterium]
MNNNLRLAFIALLLSFFSIQSAYSQTPQAIPYQAMARNAAGNLLASQPITIRFTIHDNTASGAIIYRETQNNTTTNLGLFTLNIGEGIPSLGLFNSINWGSGAKFLEVELDPAGGTSFLSMGTTKLMSVPYALYADHANVPGVPGPQGPIGLTGATGLQGAIGLTGAAGPQGPIGLTGATGPQGPIGLTGATGPQGAIGLTGATGPQGLIGLTGATGPQGPIGLTGAIGPQGAGYLATSTSSALISTGNKTFTTQAGLAYLPNTRVRIANSASNYMEGLVSSYSGSTMVVNVDRVVGAGTFASWNIGIAGDVGATGLLPNGTALGNTTYWNGTTWVVNNNKLFNDGNRIGIGSNSPKARLHVADSSVVFTGPVLPYPYITAVPPPIEGAGSRMMWYSEKAAFRAGQVEDYSSFGDNYWDMDSIGYWSFATGHVTMAKGASSVAMGVHAKANGNVSMAMGSFTKANGDGSIAIGGSTEANGVYSTAMGEGNYANGAQSTAMGFANFANGTATTSMGLLTKANGKMSTTMGHATKTNGPSSLVIGVANDTIVSVDNSAYLCVPTSPLFIIGNGDATDQNNPIRHNALVVRKDGRMGLGTNFPAARLHVADSSVVFTGADTLPVSPAPPPIEGPGNRMMWYPEKAAFRVGGVFSLFPFSIPTERYWNKDSIGKYSFASGAITLASGEGSVAMGIGSVAEGKCASAFGETNWAIGEGGMAWGIGSLASGKWATATGVGTEANGQAAATFGLTTKANGENSLASGSNTKANGFSSTSLGSHTTANGHNTLVIGVLNDTIVANSLTPSATNPLFIIGNGALTPRNALVVRQDGRMGIGTNFPTARLHVADSSVVFTGADSLPLSPAPPPIEGPGTRMMWYPEKAAFRVGRCALNDWDKDSIGQYSFAAGYDPMAKGFASTSIGTGAAYGNHAIAIGSSLYANGNYSTVIGNGSIASGEYSTVIGNYGTASGSSSVAIGASHASGGNSIAMGVNCTASGASSFTSGASNTAAGVASVAMGSQTTANGNYSLSTGDSTAANGVASVAMGQFSIANGNNSIAIGQNANTNQNYATALGNFVNANGVYSTALGFSNNANGNMSTTMGLSNNANGDGSLAIGEGSRANGYTGTVIGRYNDSIVSAQNNIQNTTPLFIIGNGTNFTNRKNAMVVRNDGRTGLGTNNPQARLHVEDSSVLFRAQPISNNVSNPPVQGAGLRMMWYADKASFRSGIVNASQWDKDSIGLYSTAFGEDTKAKGIHALSTGISTQALSDNSTAMGYLSIASGTEATAMGYSTIASGISSVAMGEGTNAIGNYTTSMGYTTTAKGAASTAMGLGTKSNGYASLVVGRFNDSIVAPQLGITSTTPLFVVGNGTSLASTSNAMVVRNDGNIGVGTNTPATKLDVNGGVKLGTNGSVLAAVIKSTNTTSSLTIPANTTSVQNYTIANVSVGASVLVSPASAITSGLVIAYARVSSAGTVEVSYRNTTAASVTLAAGVSLYITVIQ